MIRKSVVRKAEYILVLFALAALLTVFVFSFSAFGMNNSTAFAEGDDPVPATYTITFVNGDGSILQQTVEEENALPVYSGVTPTKATDMMYVYTYSTWDSEITAATEDKTYSPVFNTADNSANCDNCLFYVSAETVTYGEVITLTADFGYPTNPAITYEYDWSKDNKILDYSEQSIDIFDVEDSGTYLLVVTVTYPDAEPKVYNEFSPVVITVNPVEVAAVWSTDTDLIYNGLSQTPDVAVNSVKVSVSNGEVTIDDNYAVPVTLNGAKDASKIVYVGEAVSADKNYVVTNKNVQFTISPMEVEVEWGVREVVYNGLSQHRAATAVGAQAEKIELVFDGYGIDVSSLPYYVKVYTENRNYSLTNVESDFVIIKRTVTAVWQLQDTYTYNSANQIDALAVSFDDGTGKFVRLNVELNVIFDADRYSFINAGYYNIVASMPEEYAASYTLSADSVLTQTVRMFKAQPVIVVEQTEAEYVFDGNAKKIKATISSGEALVYAINGKTVENSFVQPGIYSVVVKSEASDNYMPASSVAVTLTIKVVKTDATGDVGGSIVNNNGISPTAKFTLTDTTEENATLFAAKWAEELVQVVSVTILDGSKEITPEGNSVIKIAVPDALKNETEVSVKYSISRNETKEETLAVKDGYVTLTVDYLGEVAFYQNTGMGNVIWWCVGAGAFVIIIIAVVLMFISRSKRIG